MSVWVCYRLNETDTKEIPGQVYAAPLKNAMDLEVEQTERWFLHKVEGCQYERQW